MLLLLLLLLLLVLLLLRFCSFVVFICEVRGEDPVTIHASVYAYVKEGDEILASAPMSISAYGAWDTGLIPAFEHTEGAELTVGVYVRCQGAGNGAWGKIDDAKLNAVP